jgi:hypothetical protein
MACAHRAGQKRRRAEAKALKDSVKPKRTKTKSVNGKVETMGVFKRGEVYWFEFVYGGRRYRESTGVKNQRVAGEIERAYRTALAKGEVGITERKTVRALRAAMEAFLDWSSESHKKPTYRRYKTSSVSMASGSRWSSTPRPSEASCCCPDDGSSNGASLGPPVSVASHETTNGSHPPSEPSTSSPSLAS